MGPIKVYLVVGEKGEYSDWRTWDVCAYEHREQAEAHVKAATDALARREQDAEERYVNRYDPVEFPTHYIEEGWKYSVEEVELWAHFDQWQEAQGLC